MKSLSPFFLTALGLLAATSVFSQNYVVVHIPPQSNDSGDISRAWQVNNKNEAVGEMEMLDGRTRPFHYNGGVVTDLGALGGLRGIAFGIAVDGDAMPCGQLSFPTDLFCFPGTPQFQQWHVSLTDQ